MIGFGVLLGLRVMEGMFMRTSFNPDEHWQASEVARYLAFGDSVSPRSLLTWEWLPPAEIRGWAHPAIFAVFYKVLAFLSLDTRWLVAWSPRLLQSLFAAVGDYGLGELGGETAQTLQVISWFMAFCYPRTYSSSLECTLFIWSLVFYVKRMSGPKTFIVSAFTLLIRPTAAVMYIPIGLHHLFLRRHSFLHVVPGAVLYLTLTLLIDRVGYGHWVFVPWNFFKFNYLHGVSSFYGTHPFLWYIYAGIPFMLGPHIILLGFSLVKKGVYFKHSLIIWISIFSIFIFSLNPHKEFRFLLPLMPLFFIIASDFFDSKSLRKYSRIVWSFLLITNIGFFVFFGYFHQSAPDAVMSELATLKPQSVLFLMGCHQTPFASHMHGIGTAWLKQLDCSPTNVRPHEAELFHSNPAAFVKNLFSSDDALIASHIVAYDDGIRSWEQVKPALESYGYEEISNHFHNLSGLFGIERRMVILKRVDSRTTPSN